MAYEVAGRQRDRAGTRRHLITVQEPDGPAVPDTDGSYTQPLTYSSPQTLYGSIVAATTSNLRRVTERSVGGTVVSMATHIVTVPYHAGITSQTRITWSDPQGGSHAANVLGADNPDGACVQLVLVVVEVVA